MPRKLSSWSFPASLVRPRCLAGCPIDPFLPPWCLAGCRVSPFLPPWCLPAPSQAVQLILSCGASQAVQLILSCLAGCGVSPFLPPWCLPGASQAVHMVLSCLPGASLVPRKLSSWGLSPVGSLCAFFFCSQSLLLDKWSCGLVAKTLALGPFMSKRSWVQLLLGSCVLLSCLCFSCIPVVAGPDDSNNLPRLGLPSSNAQRSWVQLLPGSFMLHAFLASLWLGKTG